MSNYKFTDNSDKVLDGLDKAVRNALTAIGMTAERYAKKDPQMPVDTGRARNSITYATKERSGQSVTFSYNKDGKSAKDSTQIGGGVKDNEVYIGSNVEYFPYIEFGSPTIGARHVLQRAATTHSEEYKELVKKALKGGT